MIGVERRRSSSRSCSRASRPLGTRAACRSRSRRTPSRSSPSRRSRTHWFGPLEPVLEDGDRRGPLLLPGDGQHAARADLGAARASIELMRSYAAGELEIFRRVRIPTSLPFVFSGLEGRDRARDDRRDRGRVLRRLASRRSASRSGTSVALFQLRAGLGGDRASPACSGSCSTRRSRSSSGCRLAGTRRAGTSTRSDKRVRMARNGRDVDDERGADERRFLLAAWSCS